MEMKGMESGPRSYSLNMFKDFVPMSVFAETPPGEVLLRFTLKVLFCCLIVEFCFDLAGKLDCREVKCLVECVLIYNTCFGFYLR